MIRYALELSLWLFAMAIALTGWRLLRGPDATDRILALDTLYTLAMGVVVIVGIRLRSKIYFESALIIALLGFVSTAVAARLLSRGDVIDGR